MRKIQPFSYWHSPLLEGLKAKSRDGSFFQRNSMFPSWQLMIFAHNWEYEGAVSTKLSISGEQFPSSFSLFPSQLSLVLKHRKVWRVLHRSLGVGEIHFSLQCFDITPNQQNLVFISAAQQARATRQDRWSEPVIDVYGVFFSAFVFLRLTCGVKGTWLAVVRHGEGRKLAQSLFLNIGIISLVIIRICM